MKNFFKDYEVIDITPTISPDLAVFPGDRSFARKIVLDLKKGDNVVLSEIHTTVHLGAHVDAPNHYHQEGEGIEKRSLDYYLGPCQVVEVKMKPGERIKKSDIKDKITQSRVLFKTKSFPNPNKWNDDFNSFSPEVIDYLDSCGVKTVGIDTPSVDPGEDKELLSHNQIFKKNMAIIEGIVLSHVEPGEYFLMALPLKLKDLDASPVRAVLLK